MLLLCAKQKNFQCENVKCTARQSGNNLIPPGTKADSSVTEMTRTRWKLTFIMNPSLCPLLLPTPRLQGEQWACPTADAPMLLY